MSWQPTSITREDWGTIQVVINDVDVTWFRDAPVQIDRWSSGEPFGDAQLSLDFPQVTPFDAFGTGELDWLVDWADVDVFRKRPDGTVDRDNPLFEGMLASVNDALDQDNHGITIECIGTLYQLDLYVRAPTHNSAADGVALRELIEFQFNSRTGLNLRTQNMVTEFPSWWGTIDDPNAALHLDDEGKPITGFRTSNTGSWNRVLTGFLQDHLTLMQEQDDVHGGNGGRIMWTIRHDPGRLPVLCLKDMSTIHWTLTTGTPGVAHDLSYDLTQAPNTIYGEGTDQAGTKWRNMVNVGSYKPLAILDAVSPYANNDFPNADNPNPNFDPHAVRHEMHVNYGNGVSLAQSINSAERQVATEAVPGWYGTITLDIDPEEGSRIGIRAGQNVLLKHYRGQDVLLHIAQVEVDFSDLTVTLTVDTKGRDLLTLGELISRRAENNMDATRMLRAGVSSGITDDDRAPWDREAGAGFIPRPSAEMQLQDRATTETGVRPVDDATLYVKVNASNHAARERWGFTPVLVQEYGNIAMIEMTAHDVNGNVLAVPFHIGLYGNWMGGSMNVDYMPIDDAGEPNPFSPDVFDETKNPGNVDSSRIVLWGQEGQRAGYWPGVESEGNVVTGKFRDEGGFTYQLPDGEMMIWVAIYCEAAQDVYFQGRMWKGAD